MHVIMLRATAALLTLGAALAQAQAPAQAPTQAQAQAPAPANDAATCKAASGDDSIAACSRLIARHPRYATAYYSRARVYGRNGDYDRAIADLDRAIRLQPKNADFYTERCWAYDSKHETDRAIADCTRATMLDQRKAVTFGQRADAKPDAAVIGGLDPRVHLPGMDCRDESAFTPVFRRAVPGHDAGSDSDPGAGLREQAFT